MSDVIHFFENTIDACAQIAQYPKHHLLSTAMALANLIVWPTGYVWVKSLDKKPVLDPS